MIPYNISSYALLTEIIAKTCNMISGEFIHTFGDVHIYDNHQEQVNIQLEREPYVLPTLKFNRDFTVEDVLNGNLFVSDFELENYISHPSIKAPLSTGLK